MKQALAALIVALMLTACGGGDDGESNAAPSEEPSAAPSTEAPFASDDSEEEMSACRNEPKAETEIELTQVDFMFKPQKVKVPAGEMVTLVVSNDGTVEHTFTSDELECDTGFIAAGSKKTVTFKMPDGPVPFYCIPHKTNMTGELVPS